MSTKKGFTLVEIIVVMVIIGTLATIGIQSYSASLKQGRDVKRKFDIEQIKQAVESFRVKYGEYPQFSGTIATLLSQFNLAEFNPRLPDVDPTKKPYTYGGNSSTYGLFTTLESDKVGCYKSTIISGNSECSGNGSYGAPCNTKKGYCVDTYGEFPMQ